MARKNPKEKSDRQETQASDKWGSDSPETTYKGNKVTTNTAISQIEESYIPDDADHIVLADTTWSDHGVLLDSTSATAPGAWKIYQDPDTGALVLDDSTTGTPTNPVLDFMFHQQDGPNGPYAEINGERILTSSDLNAATGTIGATYVNAGPEGDNIDGTMNFTSAEPIKFSSNLAPRGMEFDERNNEYVKRITWNDGQGDFNIRTGNVVDATTTEAYTHTGFGAVKTTYTTDGLPGVWETKVAPTGQEGDPVAWSESSIKLDTTDGFTVTGNQCITGDLKIEGTITVLGEVQQVQQQELNVGDSVITLNSNIVDTDPPLDGAFRVARGDTKPPAEILWDESEGVWKATVYDANTNTYTSFPLVTQSDIADPTSPLNQGYYTNDGGTLNGSVVFENDATGIEWARNTDYAAIKYYNTSDIAQDNRLQFEIGDNANEYFSFVRDIEGVTREEMVRISPTSDGGKLTVYGDLCIADMSPSSTGGELRIDGGSHLYLDGKKAIQYDDNYLRLNPSNDPSTPGAPGDFTGGVLLDTPLLANGGIQIGAAGSTFKVDSTGITYNGEPVLTAADMGPGSGIDADTLDGLDSTAFLRRDATDIFESPYDAAAAGQGFANMLQFPSGNFSNDSSKFEATLQTLQTVPSSTRPSFMGFRVGANPASAGIGSAYLGVALFGPDSNNPSDWDLFYGGWTKTGLNKVWHSGNDGPGSGLNADLLDGKGLNDVANVYRQPIGSAPPTETSYDGDILIDNNTTPAKIYMRANAGTWYQIFPPLYQ